MTHSDVSPPAATVKGLAGRRTGVPERTGCGTRSCTLFWSVKYDHASHDQRRRVENRSPCLTAACEGAAAAAAGSSAADGPTDKSGDDIGLPGSFQRCRSFSCAGNTPQHSHMQLHSGGRGTQSTECVRHTLKASLGTRAQRHSLFFFFLFQGTNFTHRLEFPFPLKKKEELGWSTDQHVSRPAV